MNDNREAPLSSNCFWGVEGSGCVLQDVATAMGGAPDRRLQAGDSTFELRADFILNL